MCVNLGHKNKRVIESIAEQARELPYAAPGYATAARARLSLKLLEVLPEGLNKFFFALAELRPMRPPSNCAHVYRQGQDHLAYRSYHGSTTLPSRLRAIRAVGHGAGRQGPGFVFAPETNCFNCPIKHTYPGCNIACADYIEPMIRNESDVAAIILEPVVGTNGVLVPPPEYFPRIRESATGTASC